MPRPMVRDPDRDASEVLFGTRLQPVNLTELSRRTGISSSTLSDYKRHPARMTVERLARIARARGLSGEEILSVVMIYKGR